MYRHTYVVTFCFIENTLKIFGYMYLDTRCLLCGTFNPVIVFVRPHPSDWMIKCCEVYKFKFKYENKYTNESFYIFLQFSSVSGLIEFLGTQFSIRKYFIRICSEARCYFGRFMRLQVSFPIFFGLFVPHGRGSFKHF